MSGTSLKPDFIYIAVFQLRTYISANAIPSSSYRYMRLPSMVILTVSTEPSDQRILKVPAFSSYEKVNGSFIPPRA